MVFTHIALHHFCSSHFWQVREMETMDLNWEPVTTVPSCPSHLQKKSCINYTWVQHLLCFRGIPKCM